MKKYILIIILLLLGIYFSYTKVLKGIKINMSEAFTTNNTSNIPRTIINKVKDKTIIKYLNESKTPVIKEEEIKPLIYLYNTHNNEEYSKKDLVDYSITPTVIINNYILEDIFNKNNYKTITEEEKPSTILKNNNWKYYKSYDASRILLENSIIKYPSLKYFIDIHRDSLPHSKTTININGKDYARIIFIVGLENKDYENNLSFTNKINNKLNKYYPNLSKGILKKQGRGVNGVYNQDLSPKTILIEIGGYENTITEVLNTSVAFSKCMMEVLNEENN